MSNQKSKEKKGSGFIVSLVLSAIYSFCIVYFYENNYLHLFDENMKNMVLAIIFGIIGAFLVLVFVKIFLKKFIVITSEPIYFYFQMYILYPCIGVAIGQLGLFFLFNNLLTSVIK